MDVVVKAFMSVQFVTVAIAWLTIKRLDKPVN